MDLTEWRRQARTLVDSPELGNKIPGVDADDPWSQQSLRAVESHFLRRFGDGSSIPETIRRDYQQFLGEGMVQAFHGEWVTLPGEYLGNPEFGVGYCVKYEGMDHMDVTNSMLEMALSAHTGSYWATLFETNAMLEAS
ncbi:hypothetical protein SAMN06893096_103153 [Geodermatophilus pulveris]|uniref:Uncharacterized protein n=1 Tax=Geodermatophilus pulveris TaxID=1564159 RepID=A0A239DEZ5_9ACTN|nr:hypothetical protein [Geodermatophilus pulveris]SNS30857.1 hypothetical protein SAMN06893096_103153 [Geodermatophilus pulveris]